MDTTEATGTMEKENCRVTGKWIVYNPGTELLFAECSECCYEDNDQLFIGLMMDGDTQEIVTRCPKCGARLRSYEIAE